MDKQTVRNLFAHLEQGDGAGFFEHVADDVDWTVQGTHPLAGRYRSKQDFLAGTFAKLAKVLPQGAQLSTENVLMDGDWAIVDSVRWRRRGTACGSTTAIAGCAASRMSESSKFAPIWIAGWSANCSGRTRSDGGAASHRLVKNLSPGCGGEEIVIATRYAASASPSFSTAACFARKFRRSEPAVIFTVAPSLTSPSRIFSASGSCSSFCSTRFSGRAP